MTINEKISTLNVLKSLIVNIQGNFSAELGSELYLSLKPSLESSHLILFDAKDLDSLDSVGIEFLKKITTRGEGSQSKFAVSHLPKKFWQLWDSELQSMIPRFPVRQDGIRYLESFLSDKKIGSDQSIESQDQRNQRSINEAEARQKAWVYCPHCEAINGILDFGDQKCINCGGNFYIQPNLHVSAYEKLT